MKKEKIKVIVCEPRKEAQEVEISNTLEEMSNIVGGYIGTYYPFDDSVCIVCNDDGKINGSSPCRGVYDLKGNMMYVVFGAFFLAGVRGDDFRSLTKKEAEKYMDMFKEPERLVRKDGKYRTEKITGDNVKCKEDTGESTKTEN